MKYSSSFSSYYRLTHEHKLYAIPTIIIVSTISICIPIFANKVMELRPGMTKCYTMINAFAGSAILSKGLTVVLPDVFESFSWNDNDILIPFELYALIAATLILSVFSFAWSFYTSVSPLILTTAAYNIFQDHDWCNLVKIMPVLGMMHSLIIGISTGLSTDLSKAKLLLTALTFHQYCQGIGVGEFLVTFNQILNPLPKKVLIFSTLLAAPVGVGIGICMSSISHDDQESGRKDIIDMASVWILIGRALVDLAALM